MSDERTEVREVQEAERARLPRWARRASVLFGWLVALVLFLYFFNAVSTVLLGLLAATIVACTLSPLLRFVPGPRGLAAAGAGLAFIAAVGALLMALSLPLARPIRSAFGDWPIAQQRVNAYLETWTRQLRLREPMTMESLLTAVGNFLAGSGGQQLFSRSADVSLGVLLWLAFIFVGSIFLLAEPPDVLLLPALSLAPVRHRGEIRAMLEELGPRLRRWVLGTLTSMAIVFTASLIGYAIIGLQLIVPLALLAAMCEIVPTVGPATAAIITSIFAAATGNSSKVAGVWAVYGIVQGVEAYVILPMIMRGAVKIHPAVTLFTVVLWGKIFGVPGLMLAIPINLALWSVAQRFIIQRHERESAEAIEMTCVTSE